MIERRRFSRIVYQAKAALTQDSLTVDGLVWDLSLHGMLLISEQSDLLAQDKQVEVAFTLPDSDVTIQLVGNIVGLNNNVIRLSIDHIDIESIGHLKRLVELNVGDDDLLHRDIEHLSDLGEYT
ncbi:PilZ domain-containing protein [Vibrio sp. JPW-9-11-11]|uniref:PilZ domain-containing protein n=1 Tax=Vibrio sp. JPW-9-11-11 TaxID=1416532 RepID=UPI001593CDA2|nr:PilZ domain-containing protein [Vibrio sp. JPW-9-11-11]NVD05786.1 PilZ domain-containing protein [Vibrio sp. JPW-9-11-11]